MQSGLITAFFKPLHERPVQDKDHNNGCVQTKATRNHKDLTVLDCDTHNDVGGCVSCDCVEGVSYDGVEIVRVVACDAKVNSDVIRLVHVQQADIHGSWSPPNPRYRVDHISAHVATPTGSYKELCTWTRAEKVNQPLKMVTERERCDMLSALQNNHPTVNSFYTCYQHATITPSTTDLCCSIAIKRHCKKIVVDAQAYPRTPSNLHSDLWTSVYRPLTPATVLGNETVAVSLREWLYRQLNNRHKYDEEEQVNVMLLTGPPGSGKTAAVYACAQQLDIMVHEVNSSSLRDRVSLLSMLREATLSHQVKSRTVTLATKSVILLEEVDVVFQCDRGFWSTVYELLASSKRPFILTSSEPLLLDCPHETLQFVRPTKSELSLHLQVVGLCHYVNLTSELANQIAESVECDIRQAFFELQMWLSWSHRHQAVLLSNKPSNQTITSTLKFPWRVTPSHSPQITPSHTPHQSLDSLSAHCDDVCDLDVLRGDSVKSCWWTVQPQPSLLDSLASQTVCGEWSECEEWREVAGMLGDCVHHVPQTQFQWDWMERVSETFPCQLLSRVAMATDLLPMLRVVCQMESARAITNDKRRFTHYLKYTDISRADLRLFPNFT